MNVKHEVHVVCWFSQQICGRRREKHAKSNGSYSTLPTNLHLNLPTVHEELNSKIISISDILIRLILLWRFNSILLQYGFSKKEKDILLGFVGWNFFLPLKWSII